MEINNLSGSVLVDTTPPVPGYVVDGSNIHNDEDYSSQSATVTASWADFSDPESGLSPYSLSVVINNVVHKTFDVDEDAEQFTDHSFSLQHGDQVQVQLQAINRFVVIYILFSHVICIYKLCVLKNWLLRFGGKKDYFVCVIFIFSLYIYLFIFKWGGEGGHEFSSF